jgi:hypothetical protein
MSAVGLSFQSIAAPRRRRHQLKSSATGHLGVPAAVQDMLKNISLRGGLHNNVLPGPRTTDSSFFCSSDA